MKNVTRKLVPGPFDFQGIPCKKEYEESSVLILTNFDSSANTKLI